VLRLGFVTVRARGDWHVTRLLHALSLQGEVLLLDPAALRVFCGAGPRGDVLRVTSGPHDAGRLDAVLVGRIAGPPVDEDLQLDALRALERLGVAVVNPVEALLAARDKLRTSTLLAAAGVPTPGCSSVPRARDASRALADTGPAVAKPLFGSLGEGLFRCEGRAGRAALARAAAGAPHLVQTFVPPGGTDLRLFVVGGRVEACVRRSAPPGEWRSNAARGSASVAAVPRPDWVRTAVEAARALGLVFAGVDLALEDGRPTVLEVNGFPSFRALQAATGTDVPAAVAREVARRARARGGVRGPRGSLPAAASGRGRN